MATQNFISRIPGGSPHLKIPFTMAMIDANGALQDLPFPPQGSLDKNGKPVQDGALSSTDRIVGVELMVNPRSISNNQSKIINRAQTMTSFVEDHWGDEMDVLTFQGQTATFVLGGDYLYDIRNTDGNSPTQQFLKTNGQSDPKIKARSLLFNFAGVSSDPTSGMGINDHEIGITVSQRRQTVSYRQFKRMLDLIRANGCFFDSMGMLSKRYYIMLSYGSKAYKGFFDNIDVTEEAVNPYKFTFTVTFRIEDTVYSFVDKNISSFKM